MAYHSLKRSLFLLSHLRNINVINRHSGCWFYLPYYSQTPHTHIKHKSPKMNCHHCLESHYRAVTISWLSRLIMTRKTCRLSIMCPIELICLFFYFSLAYAISTAAQMCWTNCMSKTLCIFEKHKEHYRKREPTPQPNCKGHITKAKAITHNTMKIATTKQKGPSADVDNETDQILCIIT